MVKNLKPRRAIWIAVVLGLALRLFHYWRDPSLWHDEAASVLNIIRKGFVALLGPLYADSTGPPLFLWTQKCAVLLFGDGLYALRLCSLLASCAGLTLFARVASRVLAPLGALCAVLLMAFSDRLLWHAAEARHYSSDFLIATLVLALVCLTTAWPVSRRACLFACIAPLIIFSSYPGVFLCGGLFCALWPELRRQRRWASAVILGGSIILAFVAFYFITIRVQRNAAVDAAWTGVFPDWQRPWTLPAWVIRSSIGVIDYSCRPFGGILLVPAVLGSVRLWRAGHRELMTFILAPMLLALVAALAKAYPYTGARTMVFAMPAVGLLIGSGANYLVEWRPRQVVFRPPAFALVAVPLAATVAFAGYRIATPWLRADTAGASAFVLAHRAKDEPVTANHYEFEYYFRRLGGEFFPNLRLLENSEPPPRIWIVITGGERQMRDELIAPALPRWRVLERHEFVRTSVLVAVPRR